MSYLQDKKTQRNKYIKIAIGTILLVVIFIFRIGIWSKLSSVSLFVFRPILILGNSVGGKLININSYFSSKNSLYIENEKLKNQIKESEADRANYDSVAAENANLKEILGRKIEKINFILAAILAKPDQSMYDTLVVDVGAKDGVKANAKVFAMGSVPVGRVADVYENTSKIILFSNAGEKTQVLISLGKNPLGKVSGDVFMEIVGRGGGNFEMVIPRDFTLKEGDQLVMPGINAYVIAITEKIISDPRDPFTKALLRSPVNLNELKFVEIEK